MASFGSTGSTGVRHSGELRDGEIHGEIVRR